MAVSNQALYVSQQELALKNDGWYFKRVPLSEVKGVSLVRHKRIYLLGLSILMIAFGAIVSCLMMWRALNPMPGGSFSCERMAHGNRNRRNHNPIYCQGSNSTFREA